MNRASLRSQPIKSLALVFMLVPISSCTQGGKTAQERSAATPAFSYDESEFPGAKP